MIDLNKQFDSTRSILCLNGEIPCKDFFMRNLNLPLIAADGATNTLIDMGIIPTVIVGDLDSINKEIVPADVEILHILEQSTTDLEKCLRILKERELFPCLIYGATGKESDHTLYNLSVLDEYSLHHQIIIHDSAYKTKEKYGIFVSDSLLGNLKLGAKISFFSFTRSVVSTRGLTWELNNVNLSAKESNIRNSIKSNPFEVIVHRGNVLVLFDF